MRKRFVIVLVIALAAIPVLGQNKLLTIDDIFDPVKRVNFSGTPSSPRWMKDGIHYLVVSKDRAAFPRLLKGNAVPAPAPLLITH